MVASSLAEQPNLRRQTARAAAIFWSHAIPTRREFRMTSRA